jgi:hypothetical protein
MPSSTPPPATSPLPSTTVILSLRDAGCAAASLADRILDVAAQSRVDVIVIDDGSRDEGTDALAAAISAHPDVALIRHERSAGVAARRNEGIAAARGDYIWFVDHDDEWSSDGLNALRAQARGADVVVARADYRWGTGDRDRRPVDGVQKLDGIPLTAPLTVSGERAAALLIDGAFHGFLWSKLFRREALGTDPFPLQASQSDFVGVASALAAAREVRLLPDTVYAYVRLPGSITRSRTPDVAALEHAHDAVLDRAGRHVPAQARDAFTARFLCLAAVKTAVRWNADQDAVRVALATAHRRAASLDIAAVARRSAPLGAVVLALRVCPPLLVTGLRAGLRILDLARALRGRSASLVTERNPR